MATISEALEINVRGDISGFKSAMGKLPDIAKSTVKSVSSHMLSLTKTFAKVGAAGVAAFTGFALVALKKSADTESAFANLAGLFKEPIADLGQFRSEIDRLSVSMGINSVEMTNAYYQAVSAGFRDVREATSVIEAANKAAVAGSVELPIAVEAITRVINAYSDMGYSARDATKVSDMLFQTVNYGVTTFAELAPQIGMVAGTAAKAKLPLEDMLGALATMTKFMPTAEATTSLNQLIMSFLKPTDDAVEAAAKYGIALNSMALANGNFATTLSRVSALSAEAFAELFPNVRALRGVFSLASEGANELTTNITQMKDSAGVTQNAFEKQWNTLGNAFKVVWNGINEAWRMFGDVFAQDMEELLWYVNQNMPRLFEIIKQFGLFYEEESKKIQSNEGGIAAGIKSFIMAQVEQFRKWWDSDETKEQIKLISKNIKQLFNDIVLPIAGEVGSAIAHAMIGAFKTIWDEMDIMEWVAEKLGLYNLASRFGQFQTGVGLGNLHTKFATGGLVHGPGGIDNVPASLTAGEYVVNARATAANLPLLEALNSSNYHDVSTNHFHFGSRIDQRTIRDKVIPELARAKRAGYGLTSAMARA